MPLIANNIIVGERRNEAPKPLPSSSALIPAINAGNVVVINKPQNVQILPVAPVTPVKPKPQPRKSAYHSDMTIVHKI